MSFANFALFVISSMVICATPGSNMIFAFQCGLNYGIQKTLYAMLGLMLGLFVLLATSLFGLTLINETFPWLLSAIKVVGAIYLGYLGVMSCKNATAHLEEGRLKVAPSPAQLFKTGVWVSLSNPKAILFFVAFFPKFINFGQPLWLQYLILVIVFFVVESFWQLVYASCGKKLADWLQFGQRLMWLGRAVGLVFLVIAGALLWEVCL